MSNKRKKNVWISKKWIAEKLSKSTRFDSF